MNEISISFTPEDGRNLYEFLKLDLEITEDSLLYTNEQLEKLKPPEWDKLLAHKSKDEQEIATLKRLIEKMIAADPSLAPPPESEAPKPEEPKESPKAKEPEQKAPEQSPQDTPRFSPQERRILCLVAGGMTDVNDLVEKLDSTPVSVRQYLSNLRRKTGLGLNLTPDKVAEYIKWHSITMPPVNGAVPDSEPPVIKDGKELTCETCGKPRSYGSAKQCRECYEKPKSNGEPAVSESECPRCHKHPPYCRCAKQAKRESQPAPTKPRATPAPRAEEPDDNSNAGLFPTHARSAKIGLTLVEPFTATDLSARLDAEPDGVTAAQRSFQWIAAWKRCGWIETCGFQQYRRSEKFGK